MFISGWFIVGLCIAVVYVVLLIFFPTYLSLSSFAFINSLAVDPAIICTVSTIFLI